MDGYEGEASEHLELLQGLCHAFGSTPEVDDALELSLRWLRAALMPVESTPTISRPDPAGRLRVVAGRRSSLGRRRSARRRAAFEEKRAHLLRLPDGGDGLMFLPLVARGACMGVVEIQADARLLEERRRTLDSIVSQTAIVVRNLEQRFRSEERREALSDVVDLTEDLLSLRSVSQVVERTVSYCHRLLHAPVAGWVAHARGAPFQLLATRGLRGAQRVEFWERSRQLLAVSELSQEVWRVRAERSMAPLGRAEITWLHAEGVVIAIATGARTASDVLQPVGRILPRVVEHLEVVERARQRSRRLDTALAWTAHEFRTPLLSAAASVEALGARQSASNARGVITQSSEELLELSQLVDSLLHWSAGRANIRRRRLDVVELVAATVESEPEPNRQRVVVLSPPSVIVRADRIQLQSALSNLLRNALAYSDPDSMVRIVVHNGDEYAHISVLDEGPGLPDEELGTIFDPFVRGKIGARSRKGRGLGLFVAERVIHAHGGAIWAESGALGGRFHIRLPTRAEGARSSAS